MKKIPLFLSTLLCLSYSAIYAQAPAIEWQKCFGGNYLDEGYYIEPTTDGGYIMTGITGTVNNGDVHGMHGVGYADWDILVVKMDSKGVLQWTKCLGGSNIEEGLVVHQAPDGGYLVGGDEVSSMGDGDISTTHRGGYDIWLVKLSPTGDIVWSNTYGGQMDDRFHDFKFTPDGGCIVAGSTTSTNGQVTGKHFFKDAWVLKVNSTGVLQWERCVGGNQDDEAFGVNVLTDGYVITGYSYSTDGDMTGTPGGMAAKLDLTGNILWAKALGSSLAYGYGVVKGSDGGIVISGYGHVKSALLKLDDGGNLLWSQYYGGSAGGETFFSIAVTTDGGYVMAGTATSKNGDIKCPNATALIQGWVVKTSSTGALQWQKIFSGGNTDIEQAAFPTSDGGYIVGGYTRLGTMPGYHADISTYYEAGDFYAAKLAPDAPSTLTINTPPANSCAGSPITLSLTGWPANGGYTYQWKKNGTDLNNNSPAYTASDLAYGDQVFCIVTSSDACGVPLTSNTITLSVSSVAAPKVTISADAVTVCQGSALTFTAAVAGGGPNPLYQWLLNGSATGNGGASFQTKDLKNGDLVSCSYTDNAACVLAGLNLSNVVTASVDPVLTTSVSIAGPTTAVCAGSPANFTATPVNGGSSPVYHWLINDIDIGTAGLTYSNNQLADGDVVSCSMTSNALCAVPYNANSNAWPVTVLPSGAITLQVRHSPDVICSGKQVVFTATAGATDFKPVYQWQVNGTNEGTNSTTWSSDQLIDGDVISCRLSDVSGCMTPASDAVTVTIYPTPSVGAAAPIVLPKGQSLPLLLPVTGNVAVYSWTPVTALSDPTIGDPIASPLKTTTYMLKVTSAQGCSDSGSLKVNVISKVGIPGAFSPNGDGHNDIFYVMGGPMGAVLKDMMVFDRVGRCVFQVHNVATDDPAFGWDGRVGGQAASPGTYVYEIRMGFADGTQQVLKGTVVLVR
jgi:gliding motility-associated-like protein